MATTVRLLTGYILSGIHYSAGDLVSIDDALATLLVDGKIADNAAAAISRAGTEGEVIQYPAADVLTYGKGARPASAMLYYDYLSQRPSAAAYGVGICQVGAIAYISDGSAWAKVGVVDGDNTSYNMPLSLTASQVVVGQTAYLISVKCIAGSAITLTVYDNATAAAGTTLFTRAMSAGDEATFPSKVRAINGLYASFTGTATFKLEVQNAI